MDQKTPNSEGLNRRVRVHDSKHPHLMFESEPPALSDSAGEDSQASLHLTTPAVTAGDLRQRITVTLDTEAQNTHPRFGAPTVIPRPGPPGST